MQIPDTELLVNFENLFAYSPVQWKIVSQVLTLGFAAHAAALVYFLVTAKQVHPRYRLSSYLSAVVMVSAFLELYRVWQNWDRAFVFDGAVYVLANETFDNGYRYMNWSIDVPVLLTQLLIVLGIGGVAFRRYWIQFVAGGLLMVYTGYAGQFYEAAGSTPFYVWGTISTVFFVWLLVLVYKVIFGHLGNLPEDARGMMKAVWWLLLVSWMLYPGAYLMAVMWPTADGVVARQITYTVADISSKIIYGVVLGLIAQRRSEAEGYVYEREVALDRTG
jgi:bacteriorhodopsin